MPCAGGFETLSWPERLHSLCEFTLVPSTMARGEGIKIIRSDRFKGEPHLFPFSPMGHFTSQPPRLPMPSLWIHTGYVSVGLPHGRSHLHPTCFWANAWHFTRLGMRMLIACPFAASQSTVSPCMPPRASS